MLFVLSVHGSGVTSTAGDQPFPVAEVSDTVIDLGRVEEGDSLTGCFSFKNVGKEALHIHKVKTACACTHVDYPQDIAPGGQGKICLSIDTLGFYGLRTFKAAAYCNDPSHPVIPLQVRAKIAPMVTVTPERIFFRAMVGSDLVQDICMDTKGPLPFNVQLESHDLGEKIAVEFVPVTAGKHYRLRVYNRLMTAGSYRGRIVFSSDHPGRERIVVPVFVHLTPPVAVYPSRLILDMNNCPACRVKGLYKGHLIVRAHDQKPLQILSVQPEQPGLTWGIKTMIPDVAFRLDVQYSSADALAPPPTMEIGINRTAQKALIVPLSVN